MLIHHGAVDATCPPVWSRTTQRLLERAGVDSTLVEYAGEDHTFYARWQDSIIRTVRSCGGSSTCDLGHRRGATLATTEHPGVADGTQRAADPQAGRRARVDVVRRARRRRRATWSGPRS